MNKKSRQKFKYFDNEKSFYDEIKSIFYHFQINNLDGESPTVNKGCLVTS